MFYGWNLNNAINFFRYEVKFQEGQECGGGYMKLLSKTKELDLVSLSGSHCFTVL